MCGRNDAKKTGSNEGEESQETSDKTTTTASSEEDCSVNNFNTNGCEITLAGKLLIVLDGDKDGMITKNGFKCFCELVYFNLKGTKLNVTAEVLTGSNKAINCFSIKNERVNATLLQKELKYLNSEYQPKVGEVGMALIVSDSSNPSDLFDNFQDEKEEPFIYFVSVGKQNNTSIEDSCHRQYRSINDMSEISTIGSELMENACNFYGFVENNCLSSTRITATIPALAAVQMPIVVSVIGALILAVVIVLCLIFTPKCRRKGKSKKEASVEFSAEDNRVGGISELLYSEGRTFQSNSSRDSQNICSEVQTNENREKEKNCNYMHMKFREDKIDPSIYERMVLEEDSGHAIKAIATN